MVGQAYLQNDKGAGIAWRETIDGVPKVKWKKGLDMKQIQELCAKVPTPYVAHFRIPSAGGPHWSLTHPFPVTVGAELAASGVNDQVLFHNGTWPDWRKFSLETASRQPEKFPVGRWSDTRAMAWVAAVYGLGILELINEKTAVFGATDIHLFGDGWDEVDGVLVSNTHWKHRQYFSPGEQAIRYEPKEDAATPYHAKVPASVAGSPMAGAPVVNPKTLLLPSGKPVGGASHQGTFRTSSGVEDACGGGVSVGEAAKEVPSPVCVNLPIPVKESEKHIICIRENFGGSLESDDQAAKAWALGIQPKAHRDYPKVTHFPASSDEYERRLANHRLGIIHGGSM